eukprot:s1082_g4.t1
MVLRRCLLASRLIPAVQSRSQLTKSFPTFGRTPLALPRLRGMYSTLASEEGQGHEIRVIVLKKPGSRPRKTFTPRELYQASKESQSAREKAKTAASAALALSGVGVLVWHHWAMLASFNCLGGGLILLGAALAPRPSSFSTGEKEGQTRFKLKLLNNSERWKADQKAMDFRKAMVAF